MMENNNYRRPVRMPPTPQKRRKVPKWKRFLRRYGFYIVSALILRPMKRAFGTWFGMAALRFPSASFMHANVPFLVCSLFIPEKFLQLRKNS